MTRKKKTNKTAAEHKTKTRYLDFEGKSQEVCKIEATLPNGLKETTWLNEEGEPWISRVYRPFKDGNQFMSEFTEYWPGGEGKVKVRIDYLRGTRDEFTEAGTMCRRILLCDGSVQVWDEEQEEWVPDLTEKGAKLKQERDEARIRVCELCARMGGVFRRLGGKTVECTTPESVAEVCGWGYLYNEQETKEDR